MTLTRKETIERLKQNKAAAEYYAGQSRITAEIENALKDSEAFDMAIEALSTDADGEDLIIKGAKGIQDGLYNITDGKLFKYKAKGGAVRTYPIIKL